MQSFWIVRTPPEYFIFYTKCGDYSTWHLGYSFVTFGIWRRLTDREKSEQLNLSRKEKSRVSLHKLQADDFDENVSGGLM